MRPYWNRKDWKWLVIDPCIKVPLLKIMGLVLNVLPEPTRENCHLENSKALCDTRDEFFKRLKLRPRGERERALKAMWNLGIIMHEHDEPYRDFMDWCKEDLEKRPWVPQSPMSPSHTVWRHKL